MPKKYTYKTKDGIDRFVPGYGSSVNGVLVTDQILENPNFILQEEAQAAPANPTTVAAVDKPAETPAAPIAPAPAVAATPQPQTETKES